MTTIESQLDPQTEPAPPLPQTTRDKLRTQILGEIQDRQALLEKIEQVPGLETLDLPAVIFAGRQIDFDRLTHPDAIRVLQAIGGKWNKSITDSVSDAIDYTQTVKGVLVRIWAGEPPPNCKIVEYEAEIPAEPARKEIRRKLQCL